MRVMNSYIVDVLIPTCKPNSDFSELLRQIAQQSYPVRNVIVVNTGKQYWKPEWETLVPNLYVKHIMPEEFDHGGTRQWMAEASDADILLFMTQDAVPADHYLVEELIKTFAMPSVRAAYARQLPKPDCKLLERFTRNFSYPARSDIKDKDDLPTAGIKTFFCSNVCAAYDRKTLEKLGGFPKRTIFNEDMIYGGNLVRNGYAIAYAADAKVLHSHNYSCKKQFQRNFDLGVSQAEHPEIFSEYPSEGEGIKLVKKSAAYVCKVGRPWLLIKLFFQSAAKYMGYLLGKHYQILPDVVINCCTMNKNYWKDIRQSIQK